MEVNILQTLSRSIARHCEFCHGHEAVKDGLCGACHDDLPRIRHACQHCGIALWHNGLCGVCRINPPHTDKIISPLVYRYPVTEAIKNIKYNQRVAMILPLASMLLESLSSRTGPPPEIMLPVPLHFRRWVSRGFNQSIEICKILNSELHIPYEPALIRRIDNTRPLFPLSPSERARQLKGAFRISGTLGYRSVAIVDDVVTTASTVNEMALLLRANGVEHIEAWTLARAC
jgi:ComF family protein